MLSTIKKTSGCGIPGREYHDATTPISDDGVDCRSAAGGARTRDYAGRGRRLHAKVRRRDARRHAAFVRPQAEGSGREGHQRAGRGQGFPRRAARLSGRAYRGTAAWHDRGLFESGGLLRWRRLALRYVQHSVPVQGSRPRQPHVARSGAQGVHPQPGRVQGPCGCQRRRSGGVALFRQEPDP